jgi:hypothetical protein
LTEQKKEKVVEYKNLISIGALKPADRDDDEIHAYTDNTSHLLRDARKPELSPHSRYTLAYEGLHSLATANLLQHETRPGDGKGHRTIAFDVLCDELDLDPGMRATVIQAHNLRNTNTYKTPIPPITHKQAESIIAALTSCIEKAGKKLPQIFRT